MSSTERSTIANEIKTRLGIDSLHAPDALQTEIATKHTALFITSRLYTTALSGHSKTGLAVGALSIVQDLVDTYYLRDQMLKKAEDSHEKGRNALILADRLASAVQEESLKGLKEAGMDNDAAKRVFDALEKHAASAYEQVVSARNTRPRIAHDGATFVAEAKQRMLSDPDFGRTPAALPESMRGRNWQDREGEPRHSGGHYIG